MKKEKAGPYLVFVTGTHQSPAQSFFDLLHQDHVHKWQIHYLGRHYSFSDKKTEAIEYGLFPTLGVIYHPIPAGRFHRQNLKISLFGLPQTFLGFWHSFYYLSRFRPKALVSFGGYVSVPAVLAAWILQIPVLSHVQTAELDLSSRINSSLSRFIALSFPSPNLKNPKFHLTGNLLRPLIFTKKAGNFKEIKKPFIYITGGNQGAEFINQLTLKSLPTIFSLGFSVIHQTGKQQLQSIKNKTQKIPQSIYQAQDYIFQEIGWILQNAALVISRSGSNISHELVALNKKSIFIPLPTSAKKEQEQNAAWAKEKIPSLTLSQDKTTPNSLVQAIKHLQKIKTPLTPPRLSSGNKLFWSLFLKTCQNAKK